MEKLSALVLIALFLGGIGTGVGGYVAYQIVIGTFGGSQGPPGPPGANGTDGDNGISGPLILNGIYEGEHFFGTALIPANASVILRNGDFFGAGIYIYGNLTVENSTLYQRLWPLGDAVVVLNNTAWEAPDLYTYALSVHGRASVTFYNRFGPLSHATGEEIRILCYENSQMNFIHAVPELYTISKLSVDLYDQSSFRFMNWSSLPNLALNSYDSSQILFQNTKSSGNDFYLYGHTSIIIQNATFDWNVHIYEQASIYMNDTVLPGMAWIYCYNNASVHAWNSYTIYAGIEGYDNFTLELWNSTYKYLTLNDNATAVVGLNSTVKELNTWDSTRTWIRTNSIVTTLKIYETSKVYLYASEGCSITTTNSYGGTVYNL